jgi:hypothetical protein
VDFNKPKLKTVNLSEPGTGNFRPKQPQRVTETSFIKRNRVRAVVDRFETSKKQILKKLPPPRDVPSYGLAVETRGEAPKTLPFVEAESYNVPKKYPSQEQLLARTNSRRSALFDKRAETDTGALKPPLRVHAPASQKNLVGKKEYRPPRVPVSNKNIEEKKEHRDEKASSREKPPIESCREGHGDELMAASIQFQETRERPTIGCSLPNTCMDKEAATRHFAHDSKLLSPYHMELATTLSEKLSRGSPSSDDSEENCSAQDKSSLKVSADGIKIEDEQHMRTQTQKMHNTETKPAVDCNTMSSVARIRAERSALGSSYKRNNSTRIASRIPTWSGDNHDKGKLHRPE